MPQIGDETKLLRDQAIAQHKSGNLAAAIAAYESLLHAVPSDADSLGLLAMALYQSGRRDAAREKWLASLGLAAPPHIHLRNLNNLMAAAVEADEALDAPAWKRVSVPDWPASQVPTRTELELIISTARGLLKYGRHDVAYRLIDSAKQFAAGDFAVARNFAEIMIEAGRAQEAHGLLAQLSETDPRKQAELTLAQAAAAYAAGLREEAARLTKAAIFAFPVHMTAQVPSQRLLIGVLNPAPRFATAIMSPQLLHFSGNSPANLAWRHNDLFRFWSVFAEAPDAQAAVARLPRADFILNNWVNPELLSTPGTLERVAGFIDGLGRPVLNHPRHAAATTRQRNAGRLSGIEGLKVPRVARFRNDPKNRANLVRSIGEELGFPLIIRDTYRQMGKETARIASGADLAAYLDKAAATDLYAIEFVDNPVAGGLYRKIRAAVIGDEIIISHVLFAEQWNVHREREGFPAADEAAKAILFRPEETLGKTGIAALREIRARIPLDLYGIDFDILPDGRLLFFEANAAMNISIAGRKSKGTEAIRARMRETLHRLFEQAAARGK